LGNQFPKIFPAEEKLLEKKKDLEWGAMGTRLW